MFKDFKYILILKIIIGIILLSNIHQIFNILAILSDIFFRLIFNNNSSKAKSGSFLDKFYLLNQISFLFYCLIFVYINYLPMNLTLFFIGNFILFFLAVFLKKNLQYYLKFDWYLIFSVYLTMILSQFGMFFVSPVLIFWSSVLTFLNFYFCFSIFSKSK